MLTFVTWKWRGPDPARQFASEHVNVLYAMLVRHYHAPFRLVCFTDDPAGLDEAVEALPLPATKADTMTAPRYSSHKLFPACYRRLWLFSEEATCLGERICQIDIDVIILEDITALLNSKTADFVGWSDPSAHQWNKVAGGIWLLTTGSHVEAWEDFDPATSPDVVHKAGHRGSDQAWLSYMLFPPKQRFTSRDGVCKIGWLGKGGRTPPQGVKMVFTTGLYPPWSPEVQLGHPWIIAHWRL